MQLLRSLNEFPSSLRGGAVSIGNFDGVHLGHAELVERLREMARAASGPAIVFTFDPPPVRLLRPDAAPEPLLWIERKAEILAELGVDAMLVYPTDKALLELDAKAFFDQIICGGLGARAVVEGPNFFFGHHRSGNVEVLRQLCAKADIRFDVADPIEWAGEIVSSSRVRTAILAGRIDDACTMLGRPYRIRGVVVHGAGRGAQIGYPTANVGRIDTMLPAEGIYAARAKVDGVWHPAAVSLGPNPTFDEGGLKVEAFVIGFSDMIYQRPIEVDFLAMLRQIKRFDSVDALVGQMARDVAQTVELVAAIPCGHGSAGCNQIPDVTPHFRETP